MGRWMSGKVRGVSGAEVDGIVWKIFCHIYFFSRCVCALVFDVRASGGGTARYMLSVFADIKMGGVGGLKMVDTSLNDKRTKKYWKLPNSDLKFFLNPMHYSIHCLKTAWDLWILITLKCLFECTNKITEMKRNKRMIMKIWEWVEPSQVKSRENYYEGDDSTHKNELSFHFLSEFLLIFDSS